MHTSASKYCWVNKTQSTLKEKKSTSGHWLSNYGLNCIPRKSIIDQG